MQGNCVNCRFYIPGTNHGICTRIQLLNAQKYTEEPALLVARADEESGLDALLLAKPDFSCSLFEARP